MLTTGAQLRAARGILGINQQQLARAAGINVSTLSAMEGRGFETLRSGIDTVKSVMDAFAGAGVEFTSDPPGVRLRP